MVKKAGKTKKKKSSSVKKHRVHKTKETTHERPITRTSSEVKIERVLIENFVSLQKVMTNLSAKFDNLANQISKLLDLFEISAKALAEKDFNLEKENKDNKKIIEKIDNLFEQNKIIARGLTLLHEPPTRQEPNYPHTQMPRMQRTIQAPRPNQEREVNREGYQKSISSDGLSEASPISENSKTRFRQLPGQ